MTPEDCTEQQVERILKAFITVKTKMDKDLKKEWDILKDLDPELLMIRGARFSSPEWGFLRDIGCLIITTGGTGIHRVLYRWSEDWIPFLKIWAASHVI